LKTLAVILARKNSKRLKDKHLILIDGKPLIQYTFEYAKKSPSLDDVVCSTDSDKIARLAKSFGIETIKRPDEFAKSGSHIIEAIEYTLLQYNLKNGFLPEVTVVLLGNVPIRGSTIEEGLKLFYKKRADAVFSACNVSKYHPDWMFKKGPDGRMAFERNSTRYRCQDLPAYYVATDSYIIAKTGRLLKRAPRESLYSDFGDRIFFTEEKRDATVDVDDICDLNYFRFILSEKKKKAKLDYWKTGRKGRS